MNKKDIILIAGLLLISGLSYVFFVMGEKESGNLVIITLDGVQYGTYDLAQNQEIEINADDGYNFVVIEDGEVFMQEADCPDQYCVKQGKLSDQSDSLICLPHKLIVELDADNIQPDNANQGNEGFEKEESDGIEVDIISK